MKIQDGQLKYWRNETIDNYSSLSLYIGHDKLEIGKYTLWNN